MSAFSAMLLATLSAVNAYSSSSAPELVIENKTGLRSEIPVKKVHRIRLPKGYHEGLLVERDKIWVNNGMGINTWVIDSLSGELVSEIKPVGAFSEGLTHDGASLWATDWNTRKLYRVRLENDKMVSEFEVDLGPANPAGVVWNGEYLYVITWTKGMGTQYHLLQIDKYGAVMKKLRILGISEPTQLAWDGRNLWISSWFSRRVYRLDPLSYEVTGYFRSKVKRTTGIAWDGKYFWLTGTKEDLYKIEVLEKKEEQ